MALTNRQKFELLKEAKLREARSSFLAYRRLVNPKDKWGWWQKEIAQELQKFYEDFIAGKRPKLVIQAPPQHGKLLADDTPILTPSGWVRHGDLVPGDYVYHPSGEAVKVVAVSPTGEANMRVEMTNGQVIYCHERHEWTVYSRNKKKWITLETAEMLNIGRRSKGRSPFYTGEEGKRGCHYSYQLPKVMPLYGVRIVGFAQTKSGETVSIKSISHDPQGKVGRCIQVDSPDGLYLAGETLQPTHNSVQIIDFISWVAGKNPDARTIYTSFSDRLGVRANLRLQRRYDSELYKELFPETVIGKSNVSTGSGQFSRNREIIEYVDKAGFFRNTTVKGSITGESLDLGVIDDPIRGRADARSEAVRDAAWDWFTDDFFTRFSEEAGLLAILTRWHVDDPIGRLIEKDKSVKVLSYPAIAETDEAHRKKGEALFPEHKSLEFLLDRQRVMDPGNWIALYQQRPTLEDGEIFKPEQLKVVDALPAENITWVRGWDLASTVDGDYTAGVKLGRMEDGRLIISDVVRLRVGPDERDAAMVNTAGMDGYKCTQAFPQDPGQAGKTQVLYLTRRLQGYKVKTSPESGDKITRAEPIAAQVNIGNVMILRGEWNHSFISELRMFPSGANDDQVDGLSRAFGELIQKRRSFFG